MEKTKYIDRIINDLNACAFVFHGIPVRFNQQLIVTGVGVVGTEREQHVFQLRCEGLSLRDTGKEVGVSQERVRQILGKLERKLKTYWSKYYTISVHDADEIIRREVNQQIAKYITDNQKKNESSRQGYSFDDFAINANLSVRTYNCVRRAGINTVEELVEKTPDEVISWRNLGRKSYEELEMALQRIGLMFSDVPKEKDDEKERVKTIKNVCPQLFKNTLLEREKIDFLMTLDRAFRINLTPHMKEEIKNFDPVGEYGGKEENREIQSGWHEHVLMRNVTLIINDMLNAHANEDEMIRVIKYAFVASKTRDYGLDYERAEVDFAISNLYKKYIKTDA